MKKTNKRLKRLEKVAVEVLDFFKTNSRSTLTNNTINTYTSIAVSRRVGRRTQDVISALHLLTQFGLITKVKYPGNGHTFYTGK